VLCIKQLRAQVPVLKKAVLDEQANEEQLKVICTDQKCGSYIAVLDNGIIGI